MLQEAARRDRLKKTLNNGVDAQALYAETETVAEPGAIAGSGCLVGVAG